MSRIRPDATFVKDPIAAMQDTSQGDSPLNFGRMFTTAPTSASAGTGESKGRSKNTGRGSGGNLVSKETFNKGSIKAQGIAPVTTDETDDISLLDTVTPVNSKARGR